MNKIKELREKLGIPQKAFAADLGVTQPTVSDWENGRKVPSAKSTAKIADYFGVGIDYLLCREEQEGAKNSFLVPVLGRVAAGLPMYAAENIIDWEELPKAWKSQGEFFGLKIRGHSMEPRICDGDVVIIKKQESCQSGQVAVVLVNGDEATCKKVKIGDNGITLLSNNPAFEPMYYDSDDIKNLPVQILGVVVELRGKFN